MVAIAPIVQASNEALRDPGVRARVREMHAADTPLLDMVDALDLADEMSPEIRAVIQGLSPDVVASIRQAMLDMLDNDETVMPIECGMSDAELASGVDVDVVQSRARLTVQVRPV